MKKIIIFLPLIFMLSHSNSIYPKNINNKQFFYYEYNFIIWGKKNILQKWSDFISKTPTQNACNIIDEFNKKNHDPDLMQKHFFIPNIYQSPISIGKKTSNFGMRINPFTNTGYVYHYGIDVGCQSGTKIKAASDGVVVFVGYKDEYGKMIIIEHQYKYTTLYGHLKTIFVNNGQKIKMGMAIGLSGNTGASTGPHLHFEIRHNNKPQNPMGFLRI